MDLFERIFNITINEIEDDLVELLDDGHKISIQYGSFFPDSGIFIGTLKGGYEQYIAFTINIKLNKQAKANLNLSRILNYYKKVLNLKLYKVTDSKYVLYKSYKLSDADYTEYYKIDGDKLELRISEEDIIYYIFNNDDNRSLMLGVNDIDISYKLGDYLRRYTVIGKRNDDIIVKAIYDLYKEYKDLFIDAYKLILTKYMNNKLKSFSYTKSNNTYIINMSDVFRTNFKFYPSSLLNNIFKDSINSINIEEPSIKYTNSDIIKYEFSDIISDYIKLKSLS